MTTIAESRELKKEMKLPAITLCPGLAYKNQSGGPYIREEDFDRNAYNLSDLFKETWFFQKKTSKYKILESRNILRHQLQFNLNWLLDSCSVQPLPIVLPLLYPLLDELPATLRFLDVFAALYAPLLLPGVNNTDRVFRIGCPQVEVMGSLWYNQRRRSSDWLEHAPTGPWVQQPIAEHYVGGSF